MPASACMSAFPEVPVPQVGPPEVTSRAAESESLLKLRASLGIFFLALPLRTLFLLLRRLHLLLLVLLLLLLLL